MAHTDPTSGAIYFAHYLKGKLDTQSGKVVDIGSGKGRNSVYFAEQGFDVYGLEYIQMAIDIAEQLAVKRGVNDRTHFRLADVDTRWGFEDGYFDIAIDSFSSIDIETKESRETCRDEMYRTLKKGGHALVTVCSADDEWEKELIAKYPGPEPNSCIWPQNDKFQKNYDETELREFYKPFEITEFKKVSKPAFKLGRKGIATNFWIILRK